MICGELADIPRRQLATETQLAQQLGCLAEHICILYADDSTALIALAETEKISLSQLQLNWQQWHRSQPIVLRLSHHTPSLFNCHRQPVAQWLEILLQYALAQRASDIHLEPTSLGLRLRMRLAGQLLTLQYLSADHGRQLIARVKVVADLDISEQHQPQDGRFSIATDDEQSHDFRISTCPVLHGEKLVIRCLGTLQQTPSLSQLGMTAEQLQHTSGSLKLKQGLILVTGPTGSGKTSTLYTLLQRLDHRLLNICTVEDPVEIRCDGMNQVPVQNRRQLTFARILRSLLRQDPDVLMIGEIRDTETAQVALQAAQTGHLVLASLHTNNAVESLQRLQALGVNAKEAAGALTLLISQRLLRKLCSRCGGASCKHCQDGYFGQLPVFEVIPWGADAQRCLTEGKPIRSYLQSLRLPTLHQHALTCVAANLTTEAQAERLQHASS